MPITTLDPATALIIVDLQAGFVGLPTVHPAADVIRNAAALAQAFRQQRRPVVLVNVTATAPGRTDHTRPPIPRPAGWDAFIPELQQAPTDHVVTKRSWGAFMHTDLHAYLQAAGVTQVVIAGISTSAGVESTARQAYELGYNVTLAIDAMTDMNPDTHTNSLTRIFPRLGETGTTADILAHLKPI